MMRFLHKRFIAFVLCMSVLGADILSHDVTAHFSRIISSHIEYSELNSKLYKRALHLFVDMLDPYHTLFLESEVAELVALTPEDVSMGIAAFSKGSFPHFDRVYTLYLQCYNRRQDIVQKIGTLAPDHSELSFHIPKTLKELKERIYEFIKRKMAREMQKVAWNPSHNKELTQFVVERQFAPVPLGFHELVLKACAKSLDPHSNWFTESEAAVIQERLKKELFGTGVFLEETYQGLKVTAIHPRSPAAENELLHRGDHVLAVEEHPYKAIYIVQRDGKREKITLQKEELLDHEERVRYTLHPYGSGVIATISIPSMYGNGKGPDCVTDVKNALHEIRKKHEIKGMVIDLRDNSGGFVLQAVKLAGLFIAKGVVLVSKYADGEVQYARDYTGELSYAGPLLLLTSKLTASAAEIFAQALQEYGVGLIAGDKRTYGKATMQYQNVTAKNARSYYKVTIGKYYTASGKSLQLEGVRSDIPLLSEYASYELGERYLNYPLQADTLLKNHIETLEVLHGGRFKKDPNQAVPHLRATTTDWTKMKPSLVHNSHKRLLKNKNYHLFKEHIYKNGPASFGTSDIQMSEAIDIIKDMSLIKMLEN